MCCGPVATCRFPESSALVMESLSRVVVVLCTGALGGVFPWGTGGRSSRVCHLFLACVRVASTRIKSLVSAGHGQQGNTLRQARNTLVVRNKGIEWPPAKRLRSICSKREKRKLGNSGTRKRCTVLSLDRPRPGPQSHQGGIVLSNRGGND